MKRAVVIAFNWQTEETLHTMFEGDGAADQAAGWAHPDSFLWRDFPASEGWTHFAHWNDEAGEERGKRVVDGIKTEGAWIEMVPK